MRLRKGGQAAIAFHNQIRTALLSLYTEEDNAIDLPGTALRTAREEGRFEREGWRVRKDGSRFWAHVVIAIMLGRGRHCVVHSCPGHIGGVLSGRFNKGGCASDV